MAPTSSDPAREPAEAVRLRPATVRDARDLWRWRSEPTVRRFQPLASLSSNQLRSDLARQDIADLYRGRGDRFQWIIEVGEAPAGWITLVVLNWEHGLAEIGYALSSTFQQRGFMARALYLLIEEVFLRSRLMRLEARCTVDNLPSRKVLEKLGFRREGRLRSYFKLRGQRVDNFLYALLRGDPRPLPKPAGGRRGLP